MTERAATSADYDAYLAGGAEPTPVGAGRGGRAATSADYDAYLAATPEPPGFGSYARQAVRDIVRPFGAAATAGGTTLIEGAKKINPFGRGTEGPMEAIARTAGGVGEMGMAVPAAGRAFMESLAGESDVMTRRPTVRGRELPSPAQVLGAVGEGLGMAASFPELYPRVFPKRFPVRTPVRESVSAERAQNWPGAKDSELKALPQWASSPTIPMGDRPVRFGEGPLALPPGRLGVEAETVAEVTPINRAAKALAAPPERSRLGGRVGAQRALMTDAKMDAFLNDVEPPPKFERTALGDQGVIADAAKRAIPTTRSRARAPQGDIKDTALFGQERAAEGRASDAAQGGLSFDEARDVVSGVTDAAGVNTRDAQSVASYIRSEGGIRGREIEGIPLFLKNNTGRTLDELASNIAEAQGRRPRDVERELSHTLSRYRMEKGRAIESAKRMAEPPREPRQPPITAIDEAEYKAMPPEDRQRYRDFLISQDGPAPGGLFADESGALNVGNIVKAWTRFRQRFPMEGAVIKARPNSPVISEVERWNVGMADGAKIVTDMPWWSRGRLFARKGARHLNPEAIKDAEALAVQEWIANGRTPASAQAARRHFPPDVQAAMRMREGRLPGEQTARDYFPLPRIPENQGPYLPRQTDAEARESVSLGGGPLGIGRGQGLTTGVGGHQQARVFETYRQGEAAGTVYEDPRNAILSREWHGLKLRATYRLFKNLEAKGVLFRDRARATAASPTGQPWRVEDAPGGEWWTPTEAEAKFLHDNLTESKGGGSLVSYANQLFRNPNLVNPAPHVVKNMAAKLLLARGPVMPAVLARDAVEWARGTNPTLLREFNEAMPFASSGQTAGAILAHELRAGPVQDAIKTALNTLGKLNRPSQKVIFEWADPAMRYSLFKHYRAQGKGVYEAGNHAWVDLIRYGTRGDTTDTWKQMPFNFFVPWRYGTFVSLVKQVRNHPVRTALLVGGVDYLREVRYRATGEHTHLPWDYVEAPIAQLADSETPQQFATSLGQQAALTALFGPGGSFAASQIDDLLRLGTGKATPEEALRLKNMFWGLAQIYNLPAEYAKGDYAALMMTLFLGSHSALSYQPRRLMRSMPEWMPGMRKSGIVEDAEALQTARKYRIEQAQERRSRPRLTIEEQVRGR